jgi:hypothetical protein
MVGVDCWRVAGGCLGLQDAIKQPSKQAVRVNDATARLKKFLILSRICAVKEVLPHMAGCDLDLRMRRSKGAKTIRMWPHYEIDQPRRGIVLESHGTCIRNVEVPADASSYGNPTVASSVSLQRHQPHLWPKG